MSRTALLYPLLFLGFSIFSYVLVDPNLILSSHSIYLLWQSRLWHWLVIYPERITLIYLSVIGGLFGLHGWILVQIKQGLIGKKQLWILTALSLVALMFSYPGLSHDIFNYLFNAKMVWVYHANPHLQTAQQFSNDPWLIFMHNVHTPAPYGYGWTLVSLVPSLLGLHHLKVTLLLFRLLMVGCWLLIGVLLDKHLKQMSINNAERLFRLSLFMLNPLVLIETVGNIHNDVVMMLPALAAVLLFFQLRRKKSWLQLCLAVVLLALSVSIKLATVVIPLGLLAYLWFERYSQGLARWKVVNYFQRWSWSDWLSMLLLLPLLTARSQQFLPWYLIWSLTFLPLTNRGELRLLVGLFSISALLGYAPFLFWQNYSTEQTLLRKLITFGLPIGVGLAYGIVSRTTLKSKIKRNV